jgi:hypothetical protein
MREHKEIHSSNKQSSIVRITGFFAHRRLPMGKKNILCVLRVSVAKNITANT